MEHHPAQDARDEISDVVVVPLTLDRDALEILGAARAGHVEVFHGDTGWMYSIRDESRC